MMIVILSRADSEGSQDARHFRNLRSFAPLLMNYPVILRREDAEGSQNAQLEILPLRYAQGQDDVEVISASRRPAPFTRSG